MPLDSLDAEQIASWAKDKPIYVICQGGTRSGKACQALAGRVQVVDVEGGTKAWASAGLPVVRGRKAMSLERQVRIVAGSLVVLGAVLALAVHEYFVLLSGFVGAGLVFAGITDSCAMGTMLAKMPWNQVSAGACAVPATEDASRPKAA